MGNETAADRIGVARERAGADYEGHVMTFPHCLFAVHLYRRGPHGGTAPIAELVRGCEIDLAETGEAIVDWPPVLRDLMDWGFVGYSAVPVSSN